MTTQEDDAPKTPWVKDLWGKITRLRGRVVSTCDSYAGWRSIEWRSLERIGTSKLIASSYVWIVFVPVLAKLCDKVSGEHTINLGIFKEALVINLDLPFSWKMFFFMALAFSVGKALYSMRCPQLLRFFKSYAEFRERHPGSWLLALWVTAACFGDRLLLLGHRNDLTPAISKMLPEKINTKYSSHRR